MNASQNTQSFIQIVFGMKMEMTLTNGMEWNENGNGMEWNENGNDAYEWNGMVMGMEW